MTNTMNFTRGSYAVVDSHGYTEGVRIEKNHGDGTVTVRPLGSDDTITVGAAELSLYRPELFCIKVVYTYAVPNGEPGEFGWTDTVEAASVQQALNIGRDRFIRLHMTEVEITSVSTY